MKKFVSLSVFILFSIFLTASSLPITTSSKDILTLVNKADGTPGRSFEGIIKKINGCEVVFEAEGGKYLVPAYEIYSLTFADSTSPILIRYLKMPLDDRCMKGTMDAQMYHSSSGSFWLGMLFGPFAVIGAALGNPTLSDAAYISPNRELFSDPVYLYCYSQAARKKNVQNAALGWGTWVLLVAVILGAQQ
jgi:hypothetical protein